MPVSSSRGSAKPVVNFTERRTRGSLQCIEAGNSGREMAKKCALCAPGFPPRGFFGFGGLFFHRLHACGIDGEPEGGGAAAASHVTRSDSLERAELFEGLVDRAATDAAVEELPDLFPGEAVFGPEEPRGCDRRGSSRRRRRRGRPPSRSGSPGGRGLLAGEATGGWSYSHLCEGRWAGPGYAHPQVSYLHCHAYGC